MYKNFRVSGFREPNQCGSGSGSWSGFAVTNRWILARNPLSLFVLVNVLAHGSGSAFPIRIQIQESQFNAQLLKMLFLFAALIVPCLSLVVWPCYSSACILCEVSLRANRVDFLLLIRIQLLFSRVRVLIRVRIERFQK
jgi:hypothetical protein